MAREIIRQLPYEEIVYLGDNSRCPYGPRPIEQVRSFTWEMTDFLLEEKNIKMLVIACNTATAAVYEEIKRSLPIPVIGVVHPGARSAIKVTKTGHIGVIGTIGTIQSEAYNEALLSIDGNVRITGLSCPPFVPLVESGELDSAKTERIISETLCSLKDDVKIDTLILGCTHYPLLRPAIQKVLGNKIELIDSGEETAREVSTILYHKGIARQSNYVPRHRFYTTGSPKMMGAMASEWLGFLPSVTTVSLPLSYKRV
ncbi:glutamate racemase [Scopulibacillus darangshiensis]|uniref:Glutamate racemase n=1 Tax=Scopulibacillus darangshiensis TaxID=442528 RepID=A0A4R2PAN5_9BACL|nr:glutamate racemase [Scopulibacillus darangshiensis]